jgi:hypothetical protein
MGYVLLKTEELAVLIGDNEPGQGDHMAHRAGYNGVWSLTSVYAPDNCYVPSVAGLNLEHCMDGLFMTEAGGDIFEPRSHPMRVEDIAGNAARLMQQRSPLTGVESETVFTVQEPHYIDMCFKAKLLQAPRSGRRFGFFWASYMNAPEMPALQFINADGLWASLSPDAHGRDGSNTVCHVSIETPAFGEVGRHYNSNSLAHSFSARRYDLPLMFGRPGDGSMLYLQMFDQRAPVRLCMSPSGGGVDKEKRLYNPAWDFQYVVEEADVGTQFEMRSRVVYKPYAGRDEILKLYEEWVETLDG